MKIITTGEYKKSAAGLTPKSIAQRKIKNIFLFRKLQLYIEKQDQGENRFKWIGLSMIIQWIIITPLVGLVVIETGNHLVFWFFVIAAMYLTFIPTFSEATIRTIIKTFFASILLDLAVILSALLVFFLT